MSKSKKSLHTTMMNFTPFMADTRYLEHLHKEMKLRSAREGMLQLGYYIPYFDCMGMQEHVCLSGIS